MRIFQHLDPQFRIHGLYGNVDRFHTILDDTFHIGIFQVGQCHIVALQKGQSGIIILKVDRGPHPFGILVDKTEDAFIPAGMTFIHQAFVKMDPQFLVFLFIDF